MTWQHIQIFCIACRSGGRVFSGNNRNRKKVKGKKTKVTRGTGRSAEDKRTTSELRAGAERAGDCTGTGTNLQEQTLCIKQAQGTFSPFLKTLCWFFSSYTFFLPNYSLKAHPLKQQFQQQVLAVIRGRRLWSPAGCELHRTLLATAHRLAGEETRATRQP